MSKSDEIRFLGRLDGDRIRETRRIHRSSFDFDEIRFFLTIFGDFRATISIREFFTFTCQLRSIFVNRFRSIATITHSGWNTPKWLTFFKRIVRNTSVQKKLNNFRYETLIDHHFPSFQREKSSSYVADRSFLLKLSKDAYEKANQCTDNDENKEDWTFLYMMAKIEEKLNRNEILPPVRRYLQVSWTNLPCHFPWLVLSVNSGDRDTFTLKYWQRQTSSFL